MQRGTTGNAGESGDGQPGAEAAQSQARTSPTSKAPKLPKLRAFALSSWASDRRGWLWSAPGGDTLRKGWTPLRPAHSASGG